jgi:hypothetical protein
MTRKFLIVTALVAGVAATADAQICNGTAPFTAGQMRVGASAEFPDGGKIYGGEFAWGQANGLYLGGTLARTTVDNSDISAMDFGANGGYEMRFESMPKLRFCPNASLGYMKGPDFGAIETSTLHYSIGGSVGSVVSTSDNLAIVPSAGLNWVGARAKATQGGTSATASDSWGQARLSAGFVFNRAITVAPVVTIPISHDGDETRFGFAASYNFGRSGGVMQQGGKKGNRKR